MSNLDRNVRLLIAALVVVLYFAKVISGTLAIILGVIAIIFVLTSTVNFCPLYRVFNFSTRKKE